MPTNVIELHKCAPHIQPNEQLNMQRLGNLVENTLLGPTYLLKWPTKRAGDGCIASRDVSRIARQMVSLANRRILAWVEVEDTGERVGSVMCLTVNGHEEWQCWLNGRPLPLGEKQHGKH